MRRLFLCCASSSSLAEVARAICRPSALLDDYEESPLAKDKSDAAKARHA